MNASISDCSMRRVLIAPTRGSNADHGPWEQMHDYVLIAPTRGSNEELRREGHAYTKVLIAPTRGSNRLKLCEARVTPSGPHRPYEG